MPDNELIIRLLNAVERRLRANKILQEAAAALSIALIIPVAVKLVDLVWPFRFLTVAAFFAIWAAATVAWIIWRSRGRDTLQRVAADIDRRAEAHDEIKTAFWFIRNPQKSAWVETQVRLAAQKAGRIKVDALYPRRIPRASYIAAPLILLLGILNFLPLRWNNNWFYLHGAPAFALTDAERTFLDQAMDLLKKAEQLQQTDLAQKLSEIIQGLQNGSMSKDQFSRSLSELQQAMAERNLDAGRIADGLERVAKALEPSPLTRPVATPIFSLDLNNAAKEVRNLSGKLDKSPDAALREMAERFKEASDAAGKGLEQLSQHMADAASSMRERNVPAARAALEKTAAEFERLQRVLESQRLRNDASDQISSVLNSVEGTPGETASEGQGQGEGVGKGEGQGEGKGQGEGVGTGQGEGQGEGEGIGQGEGQGEPGGDGDGEGEGGSDSREVGDGGGRGGGGAGRGGHLPARGEPTSLEVQYEKEALPVRPTRGSRPESIEESSQRERSKLDYRNVPSKLTPAQKDLLNQDPIPFEQRQFVKEYFKTIRP